MSVRNTVIAGAVAAAFLVPVAAEAAVGFTSGAVNMRTGPGTQYARITTIPAGARVDVGPCSGWCSVNYHGSHGYVSAGYISRSYANNPPPRFVRPPPPRVGFYKKPWWDDKRHAWYDGRRWYANGRWYDRPGFSLNFNFGG